MALTVDIEKRLGGFSLEVDFETEGEPTALLGASGCGKSMTLKCIAGIERPDRGRVVLNGRVLYDSERRIDLPPQKRRVGYLFQQYALFPNMTVEKNIEAGVRDRKNRREIVEGQLRLFRLGEVRRLRPWQLSGGQQQRVALARILASEPEMLLLDEPFSALDSHLRWELELELMELLKKFGGDVLLVSHRQEEVYRFCRRVSVLAEGRSEPAIPVEELFEKPGTLSAAILSGCRNFSRIERLDSRHGRCLDWGVVLETASPIPENAAFFGIRGQHLAAGKGGGNAVSCRVFRVVEDPEHDILLLRTPGGCEGRSLLQAELPKGDYAAFGAPSELFVTVPPERILVLTDAVG